MSAVDASPPEADDSTVLSFIADSGTFAAEDLESPEDMVSTRRFPFRAAFVHDQLVVPGGSSQYPERHVWNNTSGPQRRRLTFR